MATLTKDKLDLLKRAFIEEGMSPGQAASKVGIAPATANRYYEKWDAEIREGRQEQLMPGLEKSIKTLGKKVNARADNRARETSSKTTREPVRAIAEDKKVASGPCRELVHLLAQYDETTAAYSTLVSKLRQRLSALSTSDFEVLYQKTKQAQQTARTAMEALERHRADHKC
jgi:hypothetical protein